MSEIRPRVVVIGGGISGLTCLWRLHRAGIAAELMEGSDRLGGVMRTDRADGFVTETGPNTVQATPDLLELVDEIGLRTEMSEAGGNLPRFIFHRGELHPVPLGPLTLATTPLLSIGAKLTLLREPWIRRRDDRREESVEEFAVRRFGREVHDVLVAPMISGIFAGDTTRLSLQSVFPRLAELEAEHGSVVWGFFAEAMGGRAKSRAGPKGRTLISFREGLETLPRRLGERLGRNIRLNCAVERIERSGGEGGLDLGVRERGGERRISAAATVVATSVDAASRLIGSLAPVGAAALQAFELPPLASVSVAYSKNDVPRDLTGFGFLVPRTEDIRLLGCLWGSSLFSGRAPEGFVTLTCFLGGSTAPDLARLDEQATIDIVRDDLRRALGVTALPRVLAVERHARAIPQYTIGHRERVASVRQAVASVPGLFLTGNYLEGISVGDCVSQARQTAEAVKRYVSLCASA